MTSEERERMNRLCERIQEEKNHKIFSELMSELNALLANNTDDAPDPSGEDN